MELTQYIRLARKWFWLIALAAFLAGGAAYIQRSRLPTQYQARVTMAVGGYIQSPNPNSYEIYTGFQLAQTYVVLAKNYVVLEAAVDEGNLPLSPEQLAGTLSARVITDTSLITLTATHTDPVLAVDIADEVARQLVLHSPSNLTPEQQAQIDLANSEIERLRQQLEQARLRLSEIEGQLEVSSDQAQAERLTEQYDTIISQINEASSNIAMFSDSITRLQQRSNSVDIVEPARLLGAVPNNVMQTTLLGAIVGAVLAVGVALLVEYLDDSIRTPEQASQALSLPTLAVIPKFGSKRDSYPERLIAYRKPDSPVSEEYRTLRTNLMFSSNGSKAFYIITSPGPGDGKTITVANLAVTIATAGWRVLLIDADLRRPRLHEMFALDNRVGLSTLLSVDPAEYLLGSESALELPPNLAECIQQTETPGLQVITSGYLPLNPTEVLGSASMQNWFHKFRTSDHFDIILFDTPPIMVAADGSVLATTLDIPVVMVLEAGSSRPAMALRARDRLIGLQVEIKGLVLNAVSRRELSYGYGYDYYYYYYHKSASDRPSQ